MDIKSGWKTTEFWTSITTAVAGLAVMLGFITPQESGQILGGLTQAIGGVMTVVPIVAYAWSRGKAKSDIDFSSILGFLGSFAGTPQSNITVEQIEELLNKLKEEEAQTKKVKR